VKEILLNRLRVRDCERVADEGEGGDVTFDSKKAKAKEKMLKRKAEGLMRKEKKGTYEKRV
jgi:hypothetical protein